jgi:hypothetical protein
LGAVRMSGIQIRTEIPPQKKVWGCQVCRECWPKNIAKLWNEVA